MDKDEIVKELDEVKKLVLTMNDKVIQFGEQSQQVIQAIARIETALATSPNPPKTSSDG